METIYLLVLGLTESLTKILASWVDFQASCLHQKYVYELVSKILHYNYGQKTSSTELKLRFMPPNSYWL